MSFLSSVRSYVARLNQEQSAVVPVSGGKALDPAPGGRNWRVAVIGAGPQGRDQCLGLQKLANVEIAGVIDRRADALQALRERLNRPDLPVFGDAAALFAADKPDLFCVATNTVSHLALGRMAVEAGVRHVILEKPVGHCVAPARELARECARLGVRVAVNHSRRWWPDYRGVCRAIEQGLIGKLCAIHTSPAPGGLGMIGSHFFDLASFLSGSSAARVTGWIRTESEPNKRGAEFQDPSGYCVLEMRNGVRAYVDVSVDLERSSGHVLIIGKTGRIEVDEKRREWHLLTGRQGRQTFGFAAGNSISDSFGRTVLELLSGGPIACGFEEGIHALEVVIAAHHSATRGNCPVALPLSEEDARLELPLP